MIVTPICLIHTKIVNNKELLKFISNRLSCGFPSPAEGYDHSMESLDELLIKHPSATYLGRGQGESMIERGILDGSLLIIDRAVKAEHNCTIVASVEGELTVKILDLKQRLLRPANRNMKPIPLPEDINVVCEGVVTFCITPQHNFSFSC
jgi:DNA polymerase V